ncbi:MAG: hypothetical protein LUC91_02360, partial [Prevotella sp.]|nr:hypothetical protein [Prevotella sp.]
IDVVIDSLPEIEQLILNFSNCQYILYGEDYYEAPNKKALKHFYKLLNEHSNLVKIQKFTENSGYF